MRDPGRIPPPVLLIAQSAIAATSASKTKGFRLYCGSLLLCTVRGGYDGARFPQFTWNQGPGFPGLGGYHLGAGA